jgi:hypothetical protein
VREVEIYSRIEPIGWDVGVSRPPAAGPAADDIETRLDLALGAYERTI